MKLELLMKGKGTCRVCDDETEVIAWSRAEEQPTIACRMCTLRALEFELDALFDKDVDTSDWPGDNERDEVEELKKRVSNLGWR